MNSTLCNKQTIYLLGRSASAKPLKTGKVYAVRYTWLPHSNTSFNKTTHVHMVGNGQMINEFRTALMQVNLPVEFITKESFFKHGEHARSDVVNELKQLITTK